MTSQQNKAAAASSSSPPVGPPMMTPMMSPCLAGLGAYTRQLVCLCEAGTRMALLWGGGDSGKGAAGKGKKSSTKDGEHDTREKVVDGTEEEDQLLDRLRAVLNDLHSLAQLEATQLNMTLDTAAKVDKQHTSQVLLSCVREFVVLQQQFFQFGAEQLRQLIPTEDLDDDALLPPHAATTTTMPPPPAVKPSKPPAPSSSSSSSANNHPQLRATPTSTAADGGDVSRPVVQSSLSAGREEGKSTVAPAAMKEERHGSNKAQVGNLASQEELDSVIDMLSKCPRQTDDLSSQQASAVVMSNPVKQPLPTPHMMMPPPPRLPPNFPQQYQPMFTHPPPPLPPRDSLPPPPAMQSRGLPPPPPPSAGAASYDPAGQHHHVRQRSDGLLPEIAAQYPGGHLGGGGSGGGYHQPQAPHQQMPNAAASRDLTKTNTWPFRPSSSSSSARSGHLLHHQQQQQQQQQPQPPLAQQQQHHMFPGGAYDGFGSDLEYQQYVAAVKQAASEREKRAAPLTVGGMMYNPWSSGEHAANKGWNTEPNSDPSGVGRGWATTAAATTTAGGGPEESSCSDESSSNGGGGGGGGGGNEMQQWMMGLLPAQPPTPARRRHSSGGENKFIQSDPSNPAAMPMQQSMQVQHHQQQQQQQQAPTMEELTSLMEAKSTNTWPPKQPWSALKPACPSPPPPMGPNKPEQAPSMWPADLHKPLSAQWSDPLQHQHSSLSVWEPPGFDHLGVGNNNPIERKHSLM